MTVGAQEAAEAAEVARRAEEEAERVRQQEEEGRALLEAELSRLADDWEQRGHEANRGGEHASARLWWVVPLVWQATTRSLPLCGR